MPDAELRARELQDQIQWLTVSLDECRQILARTVDQNEYLVGVLEDIASVQDNEHPRTKPILLARNALYKVWHKEKEMTNAEQRVQKWLDKLTTSEATPWEGSKHVRDLLFEMAQVKESSYKARKQDIIDQRIIASAEQCGREIEMSNYKENMPEQAERYLMALLKDESYTWDGFAECLVRNTTAGDIEELIYLLQVHVKNLEGGRDETIKSVSAPEDIPNRFTADGSWPKWKGDKK